MRSNKREMVGLSTDSWFINNRRKGMQRHTETKSLPTKVSEEWERQIQLTKIWNSLKKIAIGAHKSVNNSHVQQEDWSQKIHRGGNPWMHKANMIKE